jgi:hypothetical protein
MGENLISGEWQEECISFKLVQNRWVSILVSDDETTNIHLPGSNLIADRTSYNHRIVTAMHEKLHLFVGYQ